MEDKEKYTFEEMYHFHPSNIVSMCFSAFASAAITPFLFCIIWFEKDNHNRALINLVITSFVWCAIFWNVLIQPWTIVRYIIGPVNSPLMCTVDFLLRNVLLMNANLIQSAIIIVRFICTCCVKNPTALQEEFWQLFINLWTVACSFLSQLIYFLLPGKSPMFYYLCIGEYPKDLEEKSVKMNYPHYIAGFASICIYMFVKCSIKLQTSKEAKKSLKNTYTLFSFSTYTASILLFLAVFYIPIKINSLKAEELDTYPNYILVYTFLHCIPPIVIAFLPLTLFSQKMALRNKVMSEVMITINV